MSWEPAVMAGVGGIVGMAGALGYGFKLLVDALSKQLSFLINELSAERLQLSDKLDRHIIDCKECQRLQKEGIRFGDRAKER